ncbi:MAG: metal-dependent hydrolase [Pseudomonadales bacterium]|nr:metal-dependent hydrolase [Pseudomonadales bacterium]
MVMQASTVDSKKKYTGVEVGIPVRKIDQNYDNVPEYWFDNNAFKTLFLSGFSAVLPEGEAQFMYSVRLYQSQITDPVLGAQVRAFIGQEAHHSKEHKVLNQAISARGYPLARIENRVRRYNKWARKYTSAKQQLASTVCAEHLTALMADYLLRKNSDVLPQMHSTMRNAWAWHAIEETEHKAVAFDVYSLFVGDKRLLNRTMAFTTIAFLFSTISTAVVLTLKSKQRFNWAAWKSGLGNVVDLILRSRKDYMDFYRTDFHPWDHNNRNIVEEAKRKYLTNVTILS